MNIYRETIIDGPGLRYSIYLSGCRHACKGCHNPESWNPLAGIPLTDFMIEQIIDEINANPLLDGITISGGDPFYNPSELTELLRNLKSQCKLKIWCYTGYTIEEIMQDKNLSEPLQYIDTLIDGPYISELYDPTLLWRGSNNQRIIRIKDGKPVGKY